MGAPQLTIAPIGAAKPDGEGWRTTWQIASAEPDAVRVVAVVAPHPQFRGEITLDREIRPKSATQFSLVVRTSPGPQREIENAFVIVQIQRGDERWRLLARLRVSLGDAGKPDPRIEAVTSQKVGFSGEL